jgi:hypothetical protein
MTTLRNAITWALLSGLLLITPAIGGQGWYLVLMPEGSRSTSQIRAYDTARECEKMRREIISICKAVGRKDCAQMEKQSLCVASDDPRIRANKK